MPTNKYLENLEFHEVFSFFCFIKIITLQIYRLRKRERNSCKKKKKKENKKIFAY